MNELKPYEFNFKTSPDIVHQGFFAHEAAEVVPQSVIGEKDAVDENGKLVGQQIDKSRIVPLLVAAVQELTTKNQELTARVDALSA